MASWLSYLCTTLAVVGSALATPVISLVWVQFARTRNTPPHLPWVGMKKQMFPKLRASLREFTAKRGPIDEGYEKYGKHGQAFVLPSLQWPEVALPPSNVAWMASQPEHVLSNITVLNDLIALDYLSHGPDVASRHDFSVIRRDLTRQIGNLLPEVHDELRASFDEEFGTGLDDWKAFPIYKIVTQTSRRASNRVFIGLPLCRDKRYLSAVRRWEIAFGLCSAVIRYLIPERLKPLLAPLAAMPVYYGDWRLNKSLVPLIRHRMALREQGGDSKVETDSVMPNDVLEWIIASNEKVDGSKKMSVKDIAGKAVLLNIFAVHTTAIAVTDVLIDVLSYSSASSLLDELRSEADAIMPRLDRDPRAVREMTKMDSVIRETLRFNATNGRGLQREVVKPGGVVTPDGLYLPQGTHICAVVSSKQRDTEQCDRGDEYVPLRYYRPIAASASLANGQRSAVHVSEEFLSFGLGKHECPGRFFAVPTIKVMLGHLLTQYDFEPLDKRPKFLEISDAIAPSSKVTVKVRRRKEPSWTSPGRKDDAVSGKSEAAS